MRPEAARAEALARFDDEEDRRRAELRHGVTRRGHPRLAHRQGGVAPIVRRGARASPRPSLRPAPTPARNPAPPWSNLTDVDDAADRSGRLRSPPARLGRRPCPLARRPSSFRPRRRRRANRAAHRQRVRSLRCSTVGDAARSRCWPSRKNPPATRISEDALEQNARLLEGVLDDFGVKGEIINVRPGPVVTLYELEPAPGHQILARDRPRRRYRPLDVGDLGPRRRRAGPQRHRHRTAEPAPGDGLPARTARQRRISRTRSTASRSRSARRSAASR